VASVSETFGGGSGQWICAGYTGEGIVFEVTLLTIRKVKCTAVCPRSGAYGSYEAAFSLLSSVISAYE
jgi:hypothetical protein